MASEKQPTADIVVHGTIVGGGGRGRGFWEGHPEFEGVSSGYDWRQINRRQIARGEHVRKKKEEDEEGINQSMARHPSAQEHGPRPMYSAGRGFRPPLPPPQAIGPARFPALEPGPRVNVHGTRGPREWSVSSAGEASPGRFGGKYPDAIDTWSVDTKPSGQTWMNFGTDYGEPKEPRRRR